MAIRRRSLAEEVIGIDSDAEVLQRAKLRGAIDEGSLDLEHLSESEVVIFASPMGSLTELMGKAAKYVGTSATVTDVGSVKGRIVEYGDQLFGPRFVGGHPMAGSEVSGIDAARPDLFEGAPWVLVTQHIESKVHLESFERISRMVSAIGARPVPLTAEDHDRLIALVSHLPHALSFAFARSVASDPSSSDAIDISGASYRDLTRVSRSHPELWADIMLSNSSCLLAALASFEHSLDHVRRAIESGDRRSLVALLKSK